jgi:hypothetical protein
MHYNIYYIYRKLYYLELYNHIYSDILHRHMAALLGKWENHYPPVDFGVYPMDILGQIS